VAKGAYRAMHRGRVVAVHGFLNWFSAQLVRFFPRSWVRAATATLNRAPALGAKS
jgi:short-subunit dehydrogenase